MALKPAAMHPDPELSHTGEHPANCDVCPLERGVSVHQQAGIGLALLLNSTETYGSGIAK